MVTLIDPFKGTLVEPSKGTLIDFIDPFDCNQGEKSINFYFIMVPLRKKY